MSGAFIKGDVEYTAELYHKFVAEGVPHGQVVRKISDCLQIETAAVRRRLVKAGLWEVKKGRTGRNTSPPRHQVSGARRNDENMPDPVYRDPCPRCGVRAEVGCRHAHNEINHELRSARFG